MPRRFPPVPAPGLPDLLLFDGLCNLCAASVRFVLTRDPATRFFFVSLQSPFGRELAARFGIDPEAPESNVAVLGGTAFFKLDSTLAVLGTLPGKGLARLGRRLPRPLAEWLYDRIARNRYRLFGRRESCLVPTPETAAKFLHERP